MAEQRKSARQRQSNRKYFRNLIKTLAVKQKMTPETKQH